MNGVFADDSEIIDEFVDGVFDDGLRLGLDVPRHGASFLQQLGSFLFQPDLRLEARNRQRNFVDLRDHFVVDVLLKGVERQMVRQLPLTSVISYYISSSSLSTQPTHSPSLKKNLIQTDTRVTYSFHTPDHAAF